jgi:Urocanase Rossmann-like domain
MPLEPLSPAAFAFIAQAEKAFARLLECAHPEMHLGGKLLYAGNLDEPARSFTVGASMAGAATLAACADAAAAKNAMRSGQVDFLVNSLDEALRILKNQLRKREAVAVCLSAAPAAVEAEMHARGVAPDLSLSRDLSGTFAQARELRGDPDRASDAGSAASAARREEEEKTWLTWRVTGSPALWLPKLDALVLNCLAPDDHAGRRWLERAPRYLGRLAQNVRTLHTASCTAGQITARFRRALSTGEIGPTIEFILGPWPTAHPVSLVPRS